MNEKELTNRKTTSRQKVNNSTELNFVIQNELTTIAEEGHPSKATMPEKTYIPSGYALFEILHAIEGDVNGHEDLRWRTMFYFSLLPRVYYAILFYVQTLRIREQLGLLRGKERSWLRQFLRYFRPETLPVAGPLVSYFSDFGTILQDAETGEYIYPCIPDKRNYRVEIDRETNECKLKVELQHHLVPSITQCVSLLQEFCKAEKLTDEMFEDGKFIPFALSKGGNFGGVIFPRGGEGNEEIIALLTNPVLMHPLPEDRERLIEIHAFYKRSGTATVPRITINGDHFEDGVLGDGFFRNHLIWFTECINSALIQSEFYYDSKNLSEINRAENVQEVTISKVRLTSENAKQETTGKWFMNKFKDAERAFLEEAPKINSANEWERMFALTNSTILQTSNDRFSPRWGEEQQISQERRGIEHELLVYPIPVMSGFKSVVTMEFTSNDNE